MRIIAKRKKKKVLKGGRGKKEIIQNEDLYKKLQAQISKDFRSWNHKNEC